MPVPIQVRWTEPAAKDLEEIVKFIRKDRPSAAEVVARSVFDAANNLGSFPGKGRIGKIPGTRELIVPELPYIIVYRFNAEAVHILRIYHGARNWPAVQ
ncbi:MAG TPA: type II toxin-antitoxin system RelE/ParE family toxin [Terracidiphilus sp.]|nr:type II toxin-antitoxin system RelE/ParE family toxin [Terracidiphilus sp.]